MNFLVDAQLPHRLTALLAEAGHDAIHTLDLPDGNRTSDTHICERADQDARAVITKDADFVTSHLIQGRPRSLLLISTGNLTNADLEALLLPRLAAITRALQ